MKTGLSLGVGLCLALAACSQAVVKPRVPVLHTVSVPSGSVPFFGDWLPFASAESDGLGTVSIWNASSVAVLPTPLYRGIKVLSGGELTVTGALLPLLVTDDVTAANDNLAFTRDFFRSTFNRNSYDGQGAKIKAAVEVQQYHLIPILGMKENAAWMEQFDQFIFGAGGAQLGGFAQALDVVAHEFTHAVVSYSSQLEYVGQSGALNEHLADVFGEFAQHAYAPESEPFLIGEATLRGDFADQARALRDMLNPQDGLSRQPGHMDEIPDELGPDCAATATNDNCGVHILSGIPNKAAALIIQRIGWPKAHGLFYTVMTEELGPRSDFAEYRTAVAAVCAQTLTWSDCDQVEDAFAQVGL